ncbi:MAG: DNA repair protein RecO [Bacilli bacterium]|nr:DNA repair protein RecO [Bacilli bacterium]
MIKKIEGIVVNTVDYKEDSKILNILTKEEGIIGIFAKGCKKMNSNLSSTSGIMTYGIFHIKKVTKGMPNLIEVDTINYFKNIKKDLGKMTYATYLLELSSQAYKHENNIDIYNLLISSLLKIEENFDYEVICNILELKLLEYLGIKPVLDKCVNCNSHNDIITISSYKGGYLCKNCIKEEQILNIKTLKLIRMFYYVDINKISKISISKNIKKEINFFISDYYDRYSGLYLKSKEFLDKFSKITKDT